MTERCELEKELMRLATAPTVAPTGVYTNACYDAAKEIAALRKNLEDAQIEIRNLGNMGHAQGQQEPVGWFNPWNDYHGYQQVSKEYEGKPGKIPLYAAPAQGAPEEMVPKRLLNERDDFIVAKGLWSEFTAALSSTNHCTAQEGVEPGEVASRPAHSSTHRGSGA